MLVIPALGVPDKDALHLPALGPIQANNHRPKHRSEQNQQGNRADMPGRSIAGVNEPDQMTDFNSAFQRNMAIVRWPSGSPLGSTAITAREAMDIVRIHKHSYEGTGWLRAEVNTLAATQITPKMRE